MDYDQILEHLGETGPWNWMNQGLFWIPPFIAGAMVLVYSFTGLQPDHYRCKIPACDYGSSLGFDDVPNSVFPLDDDDEEDYCKYYPPQPNVTAGECSLSSNFDLTASPLECETKEGNFIYDDFEMDDTVVTEWDLVCDDEFKVALVGSCYMAGMLTGSFVFGILGDKLGRWWALLLAILLACLAGASGYFVDNYWWYCFTRYLTGTGAMGCMLLAFIFIVEFAGKKTRTILGINAQTPFAIGEAVVSLVGIRVKDWRNFHLWTSLPLLSALAMLLIIPESPRWLIKNGKTKPFLKMMDRAQKMNKVTIPPELLQESPPPVVPSEKQKDVETDSKSSILAMGEEAEKLGISALFATPTMTKITLVMWINWIIVTIGYYGISLGIGDIGDDVFINFFLVSLVEIPGILFAAATIGHLGRKTDFVVCITLTGIGCLSAAFIEDGELSKTVVCLIGKFGAAAAFAVIFLWAGELYPTVVRSTGVGLCSTLARVGGIAAPQIALYFPTFTFDAFPMLFMGVCSLVGGCLALLLPETLGEPLVESIPEVELIGKGGKKFFSWWTTEKVQLELQRKLDQQQSRKPSCHSNVEKVSTTS